MNLATVKKQARLYSILALVVLLVLTFGIVHTIAASAAAPEFIPAQLLLNLPVTIFALLTIIRALMMLHSLTGNRSPFTLSNAKHLKWIGWLYIAYEPIVWITQQLSNRFFPITLSDGTYMTVNSTYGGVFLVSGLAILAVASIFRYGVELQQLSDETL